MDNVCRLCKQRRPLVKSHLVPSFVYRWLKESSATGHLRRGLEWNKRVQDGLKRQWLCQQCEQRLGQWEKQFAETIFLPLSRGQAARFRYDIWLLKFATSVSWRVLQFFREEDLSHFYPDLIKVVDRALEVWREFLLDLRPHPERHEQHIFLGDIVSEQTIRDMPTNINRYMLRAVDLDAAFAGDEAFVYAKMCRVVLVGFISIQKPRQWKGTKIHVRPGVIGSQEYTMPTDFGEYFFGRARKCENFYERISERQAERISHDYSQNPERAVRSETWAAMDADVILFGDKAFFSRDLENEFEKQDS